VVHESAEGGALARKRAEFIRRELEDVHMARHSIALEEELRNVEAVVHVLRHQGDLNDFAHGHNEFRVLVRGAEDLYAVVGVGELPLPLIANDLNFDLGLRGVARIDYVQDIPRCNEEDEHGNHWDCRPDQLEYKVSVGLYWQIGIGWLAAITNYRPDDQPLNEDENKCRNREHQVVEVAHLQGLLSNWVPEAYRLATACDEGEGGDEEWHGVSADHLVAAPSVSLGRLPPSR